MIFLFYRKGVYWIKFYLAFSTIWITVMKMSLKKMKNTVNIILLDIFYLHYNYYCTIYILLTCISHAVICRNCTILISHDRPPIQTTVAPTYLPTMRSEEG